MDTTDTTVHVLVDHDAEDGELAEFTAREWQRVDRGHFNRDLNMFEKKRHVLVARRAGVIVGKLAMSVQAGVAHITEVIVAENERRGGIGRMLVTRAEEIASLHLVHKVWCEVGEDWPENMVCERLGYHCARHVLFHYGGQTYNVYEKVPPKDPRPEWL